MRTLGKLILTTLVLVAGLCGDYHIAVAPGGNLMTAATWGIAEGGAGAVVYGWSAQTNTTVAYVQSSAWTCTNLDVLDGVMMAVQKLTETGTITIGVSDDNGATWTREVTINVADITTTENTYVFFKFGSTLTCDGGADYRLAVKASSAGNARFWRDGTAGNWVREPRTTATGAPGAGDILLAAKEWTAPGTGTAVSVTLDDTASTDFGGAGIGLGATFTAGTAAATNYTFKVSAVVYVEGGGTLSLGTTGTKIPSDSTFDLLFDCTSNVEFGLEIWGDATFIVQGNPISFTRTFLAADAAVNATSLTTADSTGWRDNDLIAVASTTRTAGQSEVGNLNGDAVGTTLTVDGFGGVGGGLAYAHSGTSPTRAEIVNLTRNVKVHGASTANQAFIYIRDGATVDVDYAEFYYMGSNTALKRGIEINNVSGSTSISNSVIRNFQVAGSVGFYLTGATVSNVTLTNNVGWRVSDYFVYIPVTSGSWTVSGNTFIINNVANRQIFYLLDQSGTFTNNTAVSSTQAGILFSGGDSSLGTFNNITSHSNGGTGILFQGVGGSGTTSTYSNLTSWRNTSFGIDNPSTYYLSNVVFNGGVLFGNATANFNHNRAMASDVTITGYTINSDASFGTAVGLDIQSTASYDQGHLYLLNSSFGATTAHSTADIRIVDSNLCVRLDANWVRLASGTPISGISNLHASKHGECYLAFQGYNQTLADHRTFWSFATLQNDKVTYRVAPSSERLTPNHATLKTESSPLYYTVDSGDTVKVRVYVRKSSAKDSCAAAYTGSEPRLILKANPTLGVTSDTVLATMTAAVGTWEALEATTAIAADDGAFEFVVDGDGTAGCFYVDRSKYWIRGRPTPQEQGPRTLRYATP